MRISYCSDLHLELGNINLNNTMNSDVLILAGDITTTISLKKNIIFFENVSKEFENVIYVMGNHEHYGSNFQDTKKILLETLDKFPNIHLLDNETIMVDKTQFIGSTLWTNLNGNDPSTKILLPKEMNDFRLIRYNNNKINVNDWLDEHQKSIIFLKNEMDSIYRKVVVTHFLPSPLSIPERYKNYYIINGGFASNLNDLIYDSDVYYWIHGHTHDKADYFINNTRVLCNPRGYAGYEKIAEEFKLEYFDL